MLEGLKTWAYGIGADVKDRSFWQWKRAEKEIHRVTLEAFKELSHHTTIVNELLEVRENYYRQFLEITRFKRLDIFQIIMQRAENLSLPEEDRCWASKILSYIYHVGLSHEGDVIVRDSEKAREYENKARKGVERCEQILTTGARYLYQHVIEHRNQLAASTLQKIAEAEIQLAQILYARLLEQQKLYPNLMLYYYARAAEGLPETPLSFKRKGSVIAKLKLAHFYSNGQYLPENALLATEYYYQAAQEGSLVAQEKLLKISQAGNHPAYLAANLQLGLINMRRLSADPHFAFNPEHATQFLMQARSANIHFDKYEQKLHDELCYQLAVFFKNHIRDQFETETREKFIENSLFYFNKVSEASKYYQDALREANNLQAKVALENVEKPPVSGVSQEIQENESSLDLSQQILFQQIEQLTTERNQLEENQEKLQEKLEKMKNENKKIRDENRKLRRHIENFLNEKADLMEKVNRLEKEYIKVKDNNEEMREIVSKLVQQIQSMQDQMKTLRFREEKFLFSNNALVSASTADTKRRKSGQKIVKTEEKSILPKI